MCRASVHVHGRRMLPALCGLLCASGALAAEPGAPRQKPSPYGSCRPRTGTPHSLDTRPLCPAEATKPVAASHDVVSQPPTRATAESASRKAPSAPAQPELPTRWYGWQILLADLSNLLLFNLAASEDIPELGWLGFANYLGGPAVIHLLHGQGSRALLSPALRVTLPIVGATGGFIAASGCESDGFFDLCHPAWVVLGVLAGIGTAIGVDAAFADEPIPQEQARMRLMPQLFVSERGASFGIAGSF